MIGDDAVVNAVVADWRSAPVNAHLRAALGFLEKLTLTPQQIGREDVLAARAAGLSDRALYEVIYLCFLFSTMDRLADALDFPVPNAAGRKRNAWIAALFGYRSMSG
jgi:alkylhydroperoxidase family enzyme